ncbi:hypothetical protein [Spirosoma litoris]
MDLNLIKNSDFAQGLSNWTRTGFKFVPDSDLVLTEDDKTFIRLGPQMGFYQDIILSQSGEYIIAFSYRAMWQGNGVRLKIQRIGSRDQATDSLWEYLFTETQRWTPRSVLVTLSDTMIRVVLETESGVDLSTIQVILVHK